MSTHEFFVANLTTSALTGTVKWHGGDDSQEISVAGLQPGTCSALQSFYPTGGTRDLWSWSERGREYQLNCYEHDRYVVVTISNYGIGVLPTDTSPDTWKW